MLFRSRRAKDFADTLKSTREDAATGKVDSGVETIAKAYEDWLTKGGLEILLSAITSHFQRDATLPGKIATLSRLLHEHIAPLPHVAEIRQCGMMVGIELMRNRTEPYPYEAAVGARVCRAARSHSVVIRPLGPVVVLMPPLSISADETALLVRAASAGIRAET